tara:strand:+ start:3052 stop:3636 length:585 start_codon:yes stop_codon:yes gene_type:complete
MEGAITTFMLHMVIYWGLIGYYGDSNKNGYWEACRASLKNQLFILFPSLLILFRYYPFVQNNFLGSLLLVPFHILIADIWFYFSHRLAHTKLFWKYHKMHHKYTVNISTTLDGDWFEQLFINQLSVIMGPLLLEYIGYAMNVYVFMFWTVFTTANNCWAHMESDIYHHYHHTYLKYNYGNGFYVMDRLFGSFKN